MAQMTIQYPSDAGTVPPYTAANLTDTAAVAANGHRTVLRVKNTNASAVTVSIQSFLVNDNGDTVPAHTVVVAANTGAVEIPLRKSYDKGDGTGAQITYSPSVAGVTSVLVGSIL